MFAKMIKDRKFYFAQVMWGNMGMEGKVNKERVKLMRAEEKKKTGTHMYQTNVHQNSLDTQFSKIE